MLWGWQMSDTRTEAVNLRRMDTLENREFWKSVDKANQDWETSRPDWSRTEAVTLPEDVQEAITTFHELSWESTENPSVDSWRSRLVDAGSAVGVLLKRESQKAAEA